MISGRNSTGQRFASIPAYTRAKTARPGRKPKEGQVRRQCTREYKIRVVWKIIRERLICIRARRRIPRGIRIFQAFGFSTDEQGRAKRVADRMRGHPVSSARFPLIEMGMSRKDCRAYLADRVPHRTPRSACTFCPYHSDQEWALMKTDDPESWADAVAVDKALRTPGNIVNRRMDQEMFLHRSCTPLDVIDFAALPPQTLDPFVTGECTGMCGN